MPRPISAIVYLSALSNNLAVVRRYAPTAKIWSVVKANAYGHGLARVWQSLAATDGFALLDVNEAVLLREQGWQGPILLLEGFFQVQDLPLLDRYRLTTAVHSDWQLAALEQANLSAPLDIYLKINSGLNRLGFPGEKAHQIWQRAKNVNNIREITLMSHFANADNAIGVGDQCMYIQQNCKNIPAARSMGNSAATLWYPSTYDDWVRPGIILYGASPSGRSADIADTKLRPAMTLRSELLAVQTLSPGAGVGYGSRYIATQQQRIGVVACGYADGYPLNAPDGTPVLVDGILTRINGKVSMDMLTVDLTPCPQAQMGSKVELWGENLPIDDVAMAAGTVGYELMCALSTRIPFVTG